LLFSNGTSSFAQKKENIGSEVVNVVKPTDAFKVQRLLFLMMRNAKTIKYSIFSFSVASTPSKGKAEGVDKAKQEHIFTNYTLGFGNYIKCGICQSETQ
jgi:hypothetical protein